jgi:hypothetical protein
METKKIDLNELKSLIKQIIKEEYSGRPVRFDIDNEDKPLGDLRKLIKDRTVLKLINTKDYLKMKELLKQGWIVVSENLNDPDLPVTLVKKPEHVPNESPTEYSFTSRRIR